MRRTTNRPDDHRESDLEIQRQYADKTMNSRILNKAEEPSSKVNSELAELDQKLALALETVSKLEHATSFVRQCAPTVESATKSTISGECTSQSSSLVMILKEYNMKLSTIIEYINFIISDLEI